MSKKYEKVVNRYKCPRCGKWHTWATEDNLCKKCEKEWVESKEYKDLLYKIEKGG
jgi:hypothetical protein